MPGDETASAVQHLAGQPLTADHQAVTHRMPASDCSQLTDSCSRLTGLCSQLSVSGLRSIYNAGGDLRILHGDTGQIGDGDLGRIGIVARPDALGQNIPQFA